jgi:hypothetical protein
MAASEGKMEHSGSTGISGGYKQYHEKYHHGNTVALPLCGLHHHKRHCAVFFHDALQNDAEHHAGVQQNDAEHSSNMQTD